MRKRSSMAILVCIVSFLYCGLGYSAENEEWIELFNGKDLKGWSVHSGTAKYHVEDGAIVGTTEKGSPNSFLCTDKTFGDFVLEFETKCDPALNSGVQIRSQIAEQDKVFWLRGNDGKPGKRTIPKDRVHGYQVEIAQHDNGYSGFVYDEARRGFFLGVDKPGPEARSAFKDNVWNKYRIECKGDSIKTWVNGILCADFRDSIDACGVIGLQVHAVSSSDYKPLQVRWRNIRIQVLK